MGQVPPATGENMNDLFAQIEDRAAMTPRMTALRLAGEAVTFESLHERISGYEPVMVSQGMSDNAALSAALMSLLPQSLQELPPIDKARWVAAASEWLGRYDTGFGDPLVLAV